jgi:hypothetical protein
MLRVLGEGFGNLESLRVLTICRLFGEKDGYGYQSREVVDDSLYWQAFAGASGRVRHHIELRLACSDADCWLDINFTNFAEAIQGLSTIQTFHSFEDALKWESADILMAALASLPSLENVTLDDFVDQTRGLELPGLTNLLKLPSLRSI